MLDRNRRIKQRPQKFQTNLDRFDVIITCEERVYDQTVDCKELNEENIIYGLGGRIVVWEW
jgi:hypothetical protein